MADAKSGSREGGGRGGSADPLRRPGGRRKRSAAHTIRSLGPRPSGRTDSGPSPRSFRGPAASPRRAPIPHPGSGKWRRAPKGGEGVRTIGPPRQRPIPRVPKANRHSSGRFPSACPPVRPRRRWPASAAAPSASPCPFQELIDFKPVTSIADSVASARFPAAERDEKDLRGRARTGLVLTLGVGEGERAAAARETAPLGRPAHRSRRRCYCRWSRDRRFSRTFPH